MPNAPNPVPPPGKPTIGAVWIVVVVVVGLALAAWIYSAAKPRHEPDQKTKPSPTGPP
jgi:hypothetical protein